MKADNRRRIASLSMAQGIFHSPATPGARRYPRAVSSGVSALFFPKFWHQAWPASFHGVAFRALPARSKVHRARFQPSTTSSSPEAYVVCRGHETRGSMDEWQVLGRRARRLADASCNVFEFSRQTSLCGCTFYLDPDLRERRRTADFRWGRRGADLVTNRRKQSFKLEREP